MKAKRVAICQSCRGKIETLNKTNTCDECSIRELMKEEGLKKLEGGLRFDSNGVIYE